MKKKGKEVQHAKSPSPTWAVDALIGDEEQNEGEASDGTVVGTGINYSLLNKTVNKIRRGGEKETEADSWERQKKNKDKKK